MSSLLKFTQGMNVGGDGMALIGTIGTLDISIVGATGTSRAIKLVQGPVGPESDYITGLEFPTTYSTATTASIEIDAYGSYTFELWVDVGAGLVLADSKIFSAEDDVGIVRLPDLATRTLANFDANGRGMINIHDRNWAAVRTGLGAGGGYSQIQNFGGSPLASESLLEVSGEFLAAAGASKTTLALATTLSAHTFAGDITFDNTSRNVGDRTNYAANVFTAIVGLSGGGSSNYITFDNATPQIQIVAGKTLQVNGTNLTFNGPAQIGGDITSGVPGAKNIGGSSDRWATGYFTALDVSGSSSWALDDASDNMGSVITLTHTHTGAAGAAGIGSAVLFRAESTTGGTNIDVARVGGVLTTATTGGAASAIVFEGRAAGGALAEVGRLWGTGYLGLGNGTSAPSARVHLKSENALAAATPMLLLDKDRTAVAGNVYIDFQRASATKATIKLDASDNLQITVGSQTWNFTTGGQFGSSPTMANLTSDLISANYIVGSYTSATGGIELTGAGNVCNLYSDIYSGGVNGASFKLDRNGATLAQVARSVASSTTDPRALRLTAAAITGIATTAEKQFLDVGGADWSWTWAAGTIATQRFTYFRKPTIVTGDATRAATVAIKDAPGGTVTDPLAFLIEAGNMRSLAGDVYLDAGSFQSTSGGPLVGGTHFVANNNAASSGETAQPDANLYVANRGTSKRWALGLEGGGTTAGPFYLDVSDGTTSERIIRGKYVTADGSYLRLGATATRLGFFGVDGVLRQGSFTTHAGTLSTDLPATPTAQQVGDCLRQLISFLGSTAGYGLVVSDQ